MHFVVHLQPHTLYSMENFLNEKPKLRTQKHLNDCAAQVKLRVENVYDVLGLDPLSSTMLIPKQSTLHYFYLVLEIHIR